MLCAASIHLLVFPRSDRRMLLNALFADGQPMLHFVLLCLGTTLEGCWQCCHN